MKKYIKYKNKYLNLQSATLSMLTIIKNIPNINKHPLKYVFEDMKLKHKQNTLWLEFGVASGKSINYISQFTNNTVYGFDKGAFNMNGKLPKLMVMLN